ncbi:GNAT family N-acetyltransferase [Rhodococcus spelaei]|uniref:GNAT family N-acetyltransferase n=1 Tax=Rhodococcus spelaei TaxID=2546320 RepID=UPI001FE90827|nr:GNAT family N-acetyltransferase [Rhodococcus spelaei]
MSTPVAEPADPALARVEDNPSHSRFDLWVGDELVGILGYRTASDDLDASPAGDVPGGDPQVVALMHTVVKEDFGGRGWAAILVREVLEESRVRGWRLRPVCTYVQRYLGTHTEFLALVDDAA